MVKQNLIKRVIIGAGCFSIFLFSTFLTNNNLVHASSVQAVQVSTSSATQQKADRIIASAESLIGKVHYKFGVNDPKHLIFDCSSFTKFIFAKEGINLIWGSNAQSKQGKYVNKDSLQKGDLIFFSVGTPGKIGHVGIYIGNGKFIHNTTGSVYGLTIGDLKNYQKRYITARRIL
jgi:murein DD-endopeptidase / murein LD-carboxypeptidase